jgi:hypothetical protein
MRASDNEEHGNSVEMRMREDVKNQTWKYFFVLVQGSTKSTIDAERFSFD